MTAIGWIVVAVVAGSVVWLGLALGALVREHANLRARIDDLESRMSPITLDDALPVGHRAPPWSITTPEGDVVTDASCAGRPHVLVFADADCRACDDLVPDVARASAEGVLPPTVVIARGDAGTIPDRWRASTVGVERASEVSDAFSVDVTPYVFVVDDDGAIVASGGAVVLRDVERLVAAARGITIVGGADG